MAWADEQANAAGTAADARQVTILKCDIADSTRIKVGRDLQGQADFEQGIKTIIKSLAARFGAKLERFDGDGGFLIFGAPPQPKEDAAERALRAALTLIEEVQTSDIVPGVELKIRVGVASGVIAAFRDEDLSSVAGLTIDRAERLRAAAGLNHVVLCDETRRRAAGYFKYHDLGMLPAKGFDEGIHGWGLGGASAVSSRFEAQRSTGVVVGREPILETLAELWRDALASRARPVFLSGEAGIGKSRLAHAARAMAEMDGALTLSLDCSPSTVNTPFFPIGVLLRHNLGPAFHMAGAEAALRTFLEPFVAPADRAEAYDCLAPLLGLPAPSPENVQEKTTAVLVQLLVGLLAGRPGLLLCEDLHWADDSTLQLIARICGDLAGRRLLVLATSRAAPPDALATLPDLAALPVNPLNAEDAAHLVRIVCEEALAKDAVAAIVARCEGVPLLIEEVTRAALEQPTAANDAISMVAEGDVPTPLQLVVETRLSQHPQIAAVARTAAVLGREVHVPLLASLTGAGPEAVQRLGNAGIFEAYGDGERARFRHAMIRDAIYATVMPTERRTLHSRVADALLGAFASTVDATADVLAEHLRKAGRFGEAAETRLKAAADTAVRGAYVESEGHCRAALRLVPQIPDAEAARHLEFRLLVQLGVALSGRLGYSAPDVEAAYRRAYETCGDDAEAATLYPVMRGLATVNLLRGVLKTAYEQSTQAYELARRSGNVTYVIDALSVLCYTSFYHTTYAECFGWIEQCLALYDENDGLNLPYPVPQDAAIAALSLLPTTLWMLGDPAGSEAAIRRCVEHVDRVGRDFDRALMECWFAGFRLTQQRWADSAAHARLAANISGDFTNWRELSAVAEGVAAANLSHDPADIRRAIAALDAYEASGTTATIPHYCVNLAHACIGGGDNEMARAMVRRGRETALRSAETRMLAELLILDAALETDAQLAMDLLQRAFLMAEEQGSVAVALLAAATLGDRYGLPEADLARATLEIFGARVPAPDANWMKPRLAVLRDALTPRPVGGWGSLQPVLEHHVDVLPQSVPGAGGQAEIAGAIARDVEQSAKPRPAQGRLARPV